MTAREFERAYAARSGVTVRWLRRRRTVRPCHCQAPECEGWVSVSYLSAREDWRVYGWSRWAIVGDLWRLALSYM